MSAKVGEFVRVVRPWQKGLKRAVISAIGVPNQNCIDLISGHVWLDSGHGVEHETDFYIATSEFVAVRETVAIDGARLESIVDDLVNRTGTLHTPKYSFSLRGNGNTNPTANFHSQSRLVPGPRRVLQLDLFGSEKIKSDFMSQEVNAELLVHNPPFISQADLLQELRLRQEVFQGSYSTNLSYFVRAPWEFGPDSLLNDDGLRVSILLPQDLDVSKLKFGIIAAPFRGKTIRLTIGDGIAFHDREDGVRAVSVSAPLKEAVSATVSISYDGNWYGTFTIGHEKLRPELISLANRYFLENEDLSVFLPSPGKPQGDDAKRLEAVVALVLGLGGLQVLSYQRTVTDAPDLVAVAEGPSPVLLVVEVTVGNPKAGKLDTLHRRAAGLAGAIPPLLGSRPRVYPILVTSLSHTEVGDYAIDAARMGIALAYREDIQRAAQALPRRRHLTGEDVTQAVTQRLEAKNHFQ